MCRKNIWSSGAGRRYNRNIGGRQGMQIYFAPLEGITGYIYRNAYEDYFGGIDRYYSPFVVTRDGGIMKNKEKILSLI